ncbi:NAD-dependent epimerase/dehydratase family protein [Lunatimonas lonarensis]|uniref:NAD-dependent epimerase/dehydratase family protein n=1 Tax=Lunatimonas lonarensis TaxID=1232681 RepID=UPI00055DABF6|nr:NAD(P)-dependent oxidoreductase [Lunatimonas lonarensis]
MKILITGSKGVVGNALASELKSRGKTVFGIDLTHDMGERGFEQKMFEGPWEYARCDIREYRQLERIFKEVGPFDMVYNCAAEFGRWNGEDFYENVWTTNVIGLKNILRLQEHYGFKLIHFSSSEVYGDYPGLMKESVMDTHEIKQLNDYAISKWANELMIQNSCSLYQTETVIVRLFNTYGPGEYYHPYRSVNCKFCYHALKKLPITVYKSHFRSSTFLSDAISTIATISDRFIPSRIYNIGNDELVDIGQIANIVWELTEAPLSLISFKDTEPQTTITKEADFSLATKELGHQNKVSLKYGLKLTLDWMRDLYQDGNRPFL